MSIITRRNDEMTVDEDDGVEIATDAATLMALNSSEIDTQISTAKKYPRSIRDFRTRALDMACLDEETAATMFYTVPRAGKQIQGPSVRLAEVVGVCWKNLRYGARIVEEGERFVTAQGVCMDLENNIAATIEVKRSIWGNKGRYGQDMIQTTCNAACSIALRQAIFKIVPFAFVQNIFRQAKLTAIGKAETAQQKRDKIRDWFKKLGVADEQLLGVIEKKGFEDIDEDDLIYLRGLATALRDGETTVEMAFSGQETTASKVTRSKTNDKLAQATQKPQETTPEKKADDSHQDPAEALREALAACKSKSDVTAVAKRFMVAGLDNATVMKIQEACDLRGDELPLSEGKAKQTQRTLTE